MLCEDNHFFYPKMKTLFMLKRLDNSTKWGVTEGHLLPETAPLHFYPINELRFFEKIDGTNMGLEVEDGDVIGGVKKEEEIIFSGTTDKYYVEMYNNIRNILEQCSEHKALEHVTFFGELCGVKIQSGGNYFQSRKFLIFDIFDHVNGVFFRWNAIKHFCGLLGLETVPELVYPYDSLSIDNVKMFLDNQMSVFNPEYHAEGFVVRHCDDTSVEKRYVAKIRYKDFPRIKAS